MDAEKIEALRLGLKEHYGAIAEVCVKSGFKRDYVSKVLLNKRHNDDVLLVASEVLLERRNAKKALKASIEHNLALAGIN